MFCDWSVDAHPGILHCVQDDRVKLEKRYWLFKAMRKSCTINCLLPYAFNHVVKKRLGDLGELVRHAIRNHKHIAFGDAVGIAALN